MNERSSQERHNWRRYSKAAATIAFLFALGTTSATAQAIMDELAGTRQRLSMTCTGMVLLASQGSPVISGLLLEQINSNLDLAKQDESNEQFLIRFFDFHAARAGLVAGQRQSGTILDATHRTGFLLAQLSSSGDVTSLRRIAETCVMVFRSG